jgi:hypothetical protein
MAYVWMDRNRRYFISTAYSLDEGRPYDRTRYRQLVDDKFTPAEKVTLIVPQPIACEKYYDACSAIDRHNRCRVDTLNIDKKIRVQNWAKRVNLSILSMIIVDTWQVWSKMTTDYNGEPMMKQKQFYGKLATALIKNTFDERVGSGSRTRQQNTSPSNVLNPLTQEERFGEGIHLTPTKRKRKSKDDKSKTWSLQGQCVTCKKRKTIWQCSKCVDDGDDRKCSGWICPATTGTMCFADHIAEYHQD